MKRPNIVVITGAGISKPAGIPTFEDLQELNLSPQQQEEEMIKLFNSESFKTAKPTELHKLLAEADKWADVRIYTQNIDTLHEQAGSNHVYHVHGTAEYPVMFGDEALYIDELNVDLSRADYLIIIGTRLLFLYLSILVSTYVYKRHDSTYLFCGPNPPFQYCENYKDIETYPQDLIKVLTDIKERI